MNHYRLTAQSSSKDDKNASSSKTTGELLAVKGIYTSISKTSLPSTPYKTKAKTSQIKKLATGNTSYMRVSTHTTRPFLEDQVPEMPRGFLLPWSYISYHINA